MELLIKFMESHNHRTGKVGRGHWKSSSATSLLNQGHSRLHQSGLCPTPIRATCASAQSPLKVTLKNLFLIFR